MASGTGHDPEQNIIFKEQLSTFQKIGSVSAQTYDEKEGRLKLGMFVI